MGDPLKMRVSGPLAGLVPTFREELFGLGYTPNTAAQQLRLVASLSNWLATKRLEAADLSESVIDSFMRSWRRSHVNLRTPRAMQPFIDFVDGQGIDRIHDAPTQLSAAERLLTSTYTPIWRSSRPRSTEHARPKSPLESTSPPPTSWSG